MITDYLQDTFTKRMNLESGIIETKILKWGAAEKIAKRITPDKIHITITLSRIHTKVVTR